MQSALPNLPAMTHILFLDFDGVLHPTSSSPDGYFCRVDHLKGALAGSACKLVISSSWRHHHELSALIARFPASLRGRFIGATGPPCFGRWPRYQEVLAFVRKVPDCTSWGALDDSRNEFPVDCPELIACDPNVGLDTPQIEALQLWLGRH